MLNCITLLNYRMNGLEMLRRLERLEQDLPDILHRAAANHEHEFTHFNSVQLSKGKNNQGGYLPRYVDDPYFNDIQAAIRWQEWKQRLPHTNPEKPADVMDFRINGWTHFNIVAKVSGNRLSMGNKVQFEDSISEKTNGMAWGLNPESVKLIWDMFIKRYMVNQIRIKLSR